MDTRLVIVGGGGHALSLVSALSWAGVAASGYTDPRNRGDLLPGVPWLGDDPVLKGMTPGDIWLVNGIGSNGVVRTRRDVYLALRESGHEFVEVMHPHASVCTLGTRIGNAVQILTRAVVNTGVSLGHNVLINSGAIVEHGCSVGDHCHIASGAVLCGDVTLLDSVHVGAGATLLPGVSVGAGAVIAAGAVVTQNVKPLTLIAGVPGQVKRKLDL